jgi:hypothetical protein
VSFEPQNELERSLLKAAKDPSHRPQFYRDFLESDIFIINEGPTPERPGPMVLNAGYELNTRSVQLNGKQYLQVFSSLLRIQVFVRHQVSYFKLNTIEFMKLTNGDELVLNPGSDYGKQFTRSEIASMLDGSIWKRTETIVTAKDTDVHVGQPARYPKELVRELSRFFARTKLVERAYLAHIWNPEEAEKGHTLIALEVTGEWDKILAGACAIADNVPVPDPPIDFIRIAGKGGFEDDLLDGISPFYRRKLFGIF